MQRLRVIVLKAREESTQKNSVIQNLQNNLDKRIKQSQKMEAKIKELEDALSITNEKRYKLQDTIGSMERELQSTKAHVNQMADMQTRYANTGMLNNDQFNKMLKEFDVRKRRGTTVTNDYYKNFLTETNPDGYIRTKRTMSTFMTNFNAKYNYENSNITKAKRGSLSYTTSSTVFHSLTKLYQPRATINDDIVPQTSSSSNRMYNVSVTSITATGADSDEFVDKKNNNRDSMLRRAGKGLFLGRNETYKPLLMNGIERYHVLNEGSLTWCKPNNDMLCNNSLITQDIIAQSCKEIRRNIDESLKIIEDHHVKQMYNNNNNNSNSTYRK